MQKAFKFGKLRRCAYRVYLNAAIIQIAGEAAYAEVGGVLLNEIAEAYALYTSPDIIAPCLSSWCQSRMLTHLLRRPAATWRKNHDQKNT
jgi:hypothetical protein